MKSFVISLYLKYNIDVGDSYVRLPPKGISSLLQLIEAFCHEWDPSVDKEILEAIISLPKEDVQKISTSTNLFAPLMLSSVSDELPKPFALFSVIVVITMSSMLNNF